MSELQEVEAIQAVAVAFEKLTDPEARGRVLTWAFAKYGTTLKQPPASAPAQPDHTAPPADKSGGKAAPDKTADTGGKKQSKKAKTVMKLDKSLNLTPSGKQSATDFVVAKAPSNVRQKCVVAAYYLRDVLGLEKVTADQVYTLFKHVGWELPSDMKNTLQQAGSEGYLDTADSEDIKITSTGENLVEHKLPAVKAPAAK